jgi:hypothetical protein
MKITEIKSSQLPLRVKLNKNFTLDESFDPGTILQINSYVPDIEGCFKVWVTALAKDMEHNKSVAERNWLDNNTGRFDIDIFEANKKDIDTNGNFRDVIFVMDTDDCFDIITEYDEPKYSINDVLLVINRISPTFKLINKDNVEIFIEELKNNS